MQKSSSNLVISAVENDDLSLLRAHMHHADNDSLDTALWLAAYNGNAQMLQELIPLANPLANDMQALRMAAQFDYRQCVELLLPVSDPHGDKSSVLWDASMYGATTTIDLLIPLSDPRKHARVLETFIAQRNVPGFELLISVCDPKANNSRALQAAVEANFSHAIDFLYPLSHPKKALKALQKKWPENKAKWEELETRMAYEQRQKIERNITPIERTVGRKKI